MPTQQSQGQDLRNAMPTVFFTQDFAFCVLGHDRLTFLVRLPFASADNRTFPPGLLKNDSARRGERWQVRVT